MEPFMDRRASLRRALAREEQLQAGAVHDIEQTWRRRVILDAKRQITIRRSNEYAARRSQLDDAGTVASGNAKFERC